MATSTKKSEILVTSATQQEKDNLSGALNCPVIETHMTYLGLPLAERKIPKEVYQQLINKVQQKLPTWKASQLSIGGRCVMINAVLSALPVYFMSVILLPKWVVKSIDKIRRRFLWHGHKEQGDGRRFLSLAKWDLIIRARSQGGLGIKNISEMNRSLLCKWMWMWLERRQAWWKEVNIMEDEAIRPWDCSNAGTFWKNIRTVAAPFLVSVLHAVGSGEHTQFWHDNWAGQCLKDVCPRYYLQANKFISVRQMIARQADLIQLMDDPTMNLEHTALMVSIQEAHLNQESDKVFWVRCNKHVYSVKSMYCFILACPFIRQRDEYIWHLNLPMRVAIFAWLLHRNRILTVDNLRKRGFMIISYCLLCGSDGESVQHICYHCHFTVQVHQHLGQLFGYHFQLMEPGADAHLDSATQSRLRITLQFVIWRERCRRQFQNLSSEVADVAWEVHREYTLWFLNGVH